MPVACNTKKNQTVRETTNQTRDKHDSSLDHPAWGGPMNRFNDSPPKLMAPDEFAQDLMNYVMSSTEADMSPFYQYLVAGQLSLEQVHEWIKQFYYDARSFPPLMAQIIANSQLQYDIRHMYGVNLAEELGEFNPQKEHPVLLIEVGKALGMKAEDIEFAQPIPEVLVFTEYRTKLVRDLPPLEGVAAGSLTTEATIVTRYRKIHNSLRKNYNLPSSADEFFYVHTGGASENDYGGDTNHTNEAMDVIKKYATTAELQERCRQAVWRSLEARKVYQWGLFRHIVLKNNPVYQGLLKPGTASAPQTLKKVA